MFFIVCCLSFLILYLGIQREWILFFVSLVFLLLSVLAGVLYIFRYSKLRLFLVASLLLGFICTISYVYYLNSNYLNFNKFHTLSMFDATSYPVENVKGVIISKGATSFVVQFDLEDLDWNNIVENVYIRMRIQHNKKSKPQDLEKMPYLGDTVSVSCIPNLYNKKSLFSRLEILQGILFYCRNAKLTLLEQKSLLSSIQKLSFRYLKKSLQQLPKNTLAHAILLADTNTLAAKELDIFRKMGIAHLFSVSGLHLGLIFMFFFLPFSWLGYKKTGMLVALLVALFFVVLLDFRISLLRAFLFASLFCTLSLFERKTSPFVILCFSAFCIELFFPLSFFQVGFIFSFGITAGILFLYPIFEKSIQLYPKWLGSQVSITLSAWCISSFFSVLFFQNFHALSFIYNLVLIPITSVYLFLLLCGIFIPICLIAVGWIDNIYHGFAYMHHYFWDRLFPTTTMMHLYLYCLFLFLLLSLFLFFWFRGYILYLKKYTLKIYIIFMICFFIPFIWNKLIYKSSDETSFVVFPYGVGEYYNQVLYLHGSKASFISSNDDKPFLDTRFFQKFSIKKVQVSSSLEPYLASFWSLPLDFGKYFEWLEPYLQIIDNDNSKEKFGVLKVQSQVCFIFFSLMKPEHWKNDFLEPCLKIYFVLSRKQKKSFKEGIFDSFFQNFGFSKERDLEIVGYFQMLDVP